MNDARCQTDTPEAAARRMAYRRLAASILRVDIHSLTNDLQMQRSVIACTPAGLPRTYRLVRQRSWRTRLLNAMTA
jgi:hypothetical protein